MDRFTGSDIDERYANIEREVKEIEPRIKTDAISNYIYTGGKGINYVAWVDGDEERWPTATGYSREEAKANLIEEIKERIEIADWTIWDDNKKEDT
jgi:hypothetical protein